MVKRKVIKKIIFFYSKYFNKINRLINSLLLFNKKIKLKNINFILIKIYKNKKL